MVLLKTRKPAEPFSLQSAAHQESISSTFYAGVFHTQDLFFAKTSLEKSIFVRKTRA
jgi:hypothetical protein